MWLLASFSLAHVILPPSVRNRFSGQAASSSDAEPRVDDGSQEEESGFCSTLKSLGRLEDELQMLSIAAVVATKPSPQDMCTDRDTVGSQPNNTTTVAGWFHRK
ncbi:hypothetical protein CFAM422_009439 [Trichoderma lentiforme]|uniref:Uncharacterized protein n=1 Tax=Trichoderma lentiforme TaxID=1567552 RepID=A0A9P4X9R4_9HYPO|nr:hypothetical protein CFAM422_009439 [Trichoderma lentiforme]